MTTTLVPIKTRMMQVPQDDLWDALLPALPALQNGDVVCVTSKVVSLHEGRCVKVPADKVEALALKEKLIEENSDASLPRSCSRYNVRLTLVHHALMPAAGLDESNADGHYILLPKEPFAAAKEIWQKLREVTGLDEIGVVVTDSHTVPMRWGTVGIALGFWGFAPLKDYRGTADLYGREMELSQSNLPDGMAAAAVGVMGEGTECTPAVVVRGWPNVVFKDRDFSADFLIAPEDDLYHPLLEKFKI